MPVSKEKKCKALPKPPAGKYCEGAIEEFSKDKGNMKSHIGLIKDIVIRDSGPSKAGVLFPEETALDMDAYERECSKGKKLQSRTVDMVVGLSCRNLLMVEAKFDVKDVGSMSTNDLSEKFTNTRDILNRDPDWIVDRDRIVLLSESNKLEQQKNKLRRLLSTVTPLSLSDFRRIYFE